MSAYIQIGQTALRDPATGEFLPAVPLFIRAEDREKCQPEVLIDGDAFQQEMAKKFAAYKREERKAKKTKAERMAEIDARLEEQLKELAEAEKKAR